MMRLKNFKNLVKYLIKTSFVHAMSVLCFEQLEERKSLENSKADKI